MTRRRALISAMGAAATARLRGQQSAATSPAPAPPQTDLDRLISVYDFEADAKTKIAAGVWERIIGGAADEITLKWNREAYDHIRLKPRVLVDVSKIDTRVKLFGTELPFPIVLAPTGGQGLIMPQGDLVAARGAGAASATYVISSSAGMKIEDIAKVSTGPTWFLLYVQKDRGFTRDLVQKAEDLGCRVICVTVDSPTFALRNREQRAAAQMPTRALPNLPSPSYLDPALTWKDIEWLQSFARKPVVLKGILNPDDASLAVKTGVAGIIVSNHGARNLDTVPATIDALPLVVEKVAGRVPVLVDGGIRRGTDILKALALGAAAIQIGRPYLWGMGVAGAPGIAKVVEILRREFELAMALTGRPTLASIDRTVIWG